MKEEKLYLEDILERIQMIEQFTSQGEDAFRNSLSDREAAARCFEIIGEIVKRLSTETLDAYPNVTWRDWARFRDFLIHNYDYVNFGVVWRTSQINMPILKQAIEDMLAKSDT